MENTKIEILTFKPIYLKENGKQILEKLCNEAPDFKPDFYGNWEPLKQKFDIKDLDNVLNSWNKTHFLWKKKKPKSDGYITITNPTFKHKNNSIYMTIYTQKYDMKQILNLFYNWCNALAPYFSCITKLTTNEINKGRISTVVHNLDKMKTQFSFILTIHQLQKYIPDLYWLTVFGENYIKFFGRDKLLSCPVYNIKELDNGCIILQLSEDIQDLENNVDLIEETRNKAKEHLNKDAFFDESKGINGKYQTPWF